MQWMHYYDMVPEDVAMVIETFRSVFPRTTVWMNPMAADIFLIGSEEALALDARDLDRKFSPEAVRKSLARADIIEPADIFRTFVLDEEAAGKIAAGAKIHSDDRPYLEFRAPRALHSRTTWRNVEIFLSLLSDPLPLFSPPPPPHFMGRLLGNLNGRKEALERIGFLFRHR